MARALLFAAAVAVDGAYALLDEVELDTIPLTYNSENAAPRARWTLSHALDTMPPAMLAQYQAEADARGETLQKIVYGEMMSSLPCP